MKKIVFLIFIFFIAQLNIFALEINDNLYITNNNIKLSIEEYNKLSEKLKIPDDILDNMNDDMIDTLLNNNIIKYSYTDNYIKTIYKVDKFGYVLSSSDSYITKKEYDNIKSVNSLNSYENGVEYQTSAKRLIMQYYKTTSETIADLYAIWRTTPSIKSYDVIGFRYITGVDFRNAYGKQYYDNNTQYYSYTGTNMQRFYNGIGISMNLVDSASNYSLYIQARIENSDTFKTLYGSYQHATHNVTLASSQNYIISSTGLGSVFKFSSNTISGYYDGMSGLCLDNYQIDTNN